jgi:hypothetical protein
MEYCSTVPPYQQVADQGGASSSTPSVMVPVGVLKKPDASNSGEQSEPKNVSIFSEYIEGWLNGQISKIDLQFWTVVSVRAGRENSFNFAVRTKGLIKLKVRKNVNFGFELYFFGSKYLGV